MMRRRTKQKILVVLFVFAMTFAVMTASAGAIRGNPFTWCWPIWTC